jgi:hypothetical protein
MMARRRGWGWIRIRATRDNAASAQDQRIRFHPKCNLPVLSMSKGFFCTARPES